MIGISHQRSSVSAPVMIFHLPSVDKDGRVEKKDTAFTPIYKVVKKWRSRWNPGIEVWSVRLKLAFFVKRFVEKYNFEIEGEKQAIAGLAKKIGLDWSKRITLNYLELFERLKKELNLPFSDVTFANFEPIEIDFKKHLHLLHN